MPNNENGISKDQAIEILRGLVEVMRDCEGVKEVYMPDDAYDLLKEDKVSKDQVVACMKGLLDKL